MRPLDHNASKNNQWKQLSCDQSSDKKGMIYQQHMISITAHKVSSLNDKKNKQEAHEPHRSPEKTVQINKHI